MWLEMVGDGMGCDGGEVRRLSMMFEIWPGDFAGYLCQYPKCRIIL
jgi:hypothetical protein